MTIILKTNSQATASVGSIHGNTGPQDFVGMLDFARGQYFTVLDGTRTDYAADEAVSVARTGVAANYFDRDGVLRSAPANKPRFRFDHESDAYGLYVNRQSKNLLTDTPTDGSNVSFGASGVNTPITLSWEGSGDASLTSANLTLVGSYVSGRRKAKRYSKSVSTPFTATINLSGDTSFQQVEEYARQPTERLGFDQTVGSDTVTLGVPFRSLIGSAATIVARVVVPTRFSDDYSYGSGSGSIPLAVKTGQGQGGLYVTTNMNNLAGANDTIRRQADGESAGAGTTLTLINGVLRKEIVFGLGFAGSGADVGLISYGLSARATGFEPLSGFVSTHIGGASGINNYDNLMNAIYTHVVIYDRLLSKDELDLMATMWMN
ncbi:hypothetical protein GCM10019059_37670 [Camelimonas fluminis]|uniref:Uncharacterized protein n=1 Tax=Camelimonas fluminis TaxID=1576911 RepID=A0ABV7UNC1_9HYPH|nr:hypothetical protein [Camelimonas fluminis]GHE74621.1 hypothetical protein GCM10019059_37670 [Camelimonas fluminis]